MNLATTYLGLPLSSPFVVGASPCCDDVEMAQRVQDAGASAIVMRSLFAEQIDHPDALPTPQAQDITDELTDSAEYQFTPDGYLRHVTHLKRALSIPVIASLNGHRPGHWIEFARQLEGAGADAIELNFYQVVTDASIAADQVEHEMLETVRRVSGSVRIPVAAKLSPFHSSVVQLAVALELAGAAGIVLFNRFYQPDVNTQDIEVQPVLRLSDPGELLLRLRWLAILSPQLRSTLIATGGIHSWNDVVKTILAGADAVQIVSVVLRHGPEVISTLRAGLEGWMREHGCCSLDDFRGKLNHRRCADSAAYERANYIRVLQSWRR